MSKKDQKNAEYVPINPNEDEDESHYRGGRTAKPRRHNISLCFLILSWCITSIVTVLYSIEKYRESSGRVIFDQRMYCTIQSHFIDSLI